jgi:hypothetical protein
MIKRLARLADRSRLGRLADKSSSSPAGTAAIKVSITVGSLSLDATTIPALPFSNSIGLAPNLMEINKLLMIGASQHKRYCEKQRSD